MPAQRPFETLNAGEITRLMQLAIEAGIRTEEFSQLLVRAYGALAAEFGFELWFRDQVRHQARRECGRSLGHVGTLARRRAH